MGTFKEPLNPWINPIVDAATSADDFLLTDVRKKKMTVYIGILPNKLAESRLIVNLLFSQLINLNTKELPQSNPDVLKHQCLLLMDEFTSIGKVDIIATAVSYMAGYNIRLLPIIQSMAQLDAVYGKEQARTLITNHAMQIIYAPREQQDANDYSDMLGYTTVRRENITRSREISRSEVEERRALMLPQELKAMGPDREVFLFEGIPHPVQCDKIKYYQDKLFTKRLIGKTNVPVLDLSIKQRPKAATPTQQAQPTLQTEQAATQSDQASAAIDPNQHTLGDDDMNLKQLAAAALTVSTLTATAIGVAGCQDNYTKYIKPRQNGYEIEYDRVGKPRLYKIRVDTSKVPSNAMKDVSRIFVYYDIKNEDDCLPAPDNWFAGAREYLTSRTMEYPLHQTENKIFSGTFPINMFENKDYFSFGVCNLEMLGVSAYLTSQDGRTVTAEIGSLYQMNGGNWSYQVEPAIFEKDMFVNHFARDDFLPVREMDSGKFESFFPENKRTYSPSEVFSITITIKETL